MGGGWALVKFYPYEKGGGKGLSHAEGGTKSFWVVFTLWLEVSHIEGGGTKNFTL